MSNATAAARYAYESKIAEAAGDYYAALADKTTDPRWPALRDSHYEHAAELLARQYKHMVRAARQAV